MTRQTFRVVLTTTFLMLSATAATGEDWLHEFFENSAITARRVRYWPQPFVYADRRATVAPFKMMVSKGWQAQNTVGAHLFDSKTGQLNVAGKLKIRAILADTPVAYRAIFVHVASNQDETTRRLDVVQQYVVNIVPSGALPPVRVTDQAPRMHSAEYVDSINRRFTSSTPVPRLPDASGGEKTEQ